MMKENKLIDLTNEELLKQKKLVGGVSGALVGILTILIIFIILMVFRNGMTAVTIPLSIIPIAMLPIVVLNLRHLKLIKNELESRNMS